MTTSESKPTPSQKALSYYRQYRKLHPLPEGWTERHIYRPNAEPENEWNRLIFENVEHILDVCLHDANRREATGNVGACCWRKDRRCPSEEEVYIVAQSLMGSEIAPHFCELVSLESTLDADGLPVHLDCDEPEKDSDDHFAVEIGFEYPPKPMTQDSPNS